MLDCKEYEKLIPDFLSEGLSADMTEKFICHVENCTECMEELSIQFLITEGMARLEEGSTFELARELENFIEENKDWIYMIRCQKMVKMASGIIGICTLMAVLCMVIVL